MSSPYVWLRYHLCGVLLMFMWVSSAVSSHRKRHVCYVSEGKAMTSNSKQTSTARRQIFYSVYSIDDV